MERAKVDGMYIFLGLFVVLSDVRRHFMKVRPTWRIVRNKNQEKINLDLLEIELIPEEFVEF